MRTITNLILPYSIELNEHFHTYRVNDEVKPGYSEIMEAVGLRPKYPDEPFYREFGQAGHEMTSLHDMGRLNALRLDGRLVPVLTSYRDFLSTTGLEVVANEVKLYSPRHGFCVRIDRCVKLNGRIGILEIKIGTSVDWSAEHQVVSHQVAWDDNFPNDPIRFKYVLHLRRLDPWPITSATRWTWSLVTKWTDSPKQTWLSVLDWYALKKKRGNLL